MGRKRNQIIACLLIVKTAYCCISNKYEYKRNGDDVTLQFQAIKVNPENPSLGVSNILLSPSGGQLLSVLYKNGNVRTVSDCTGCTFTGNTTTGNLSVRINSLQKSDAGTYKHALTNNDNVLDCVTVYILGVPIKPAILVNKHPNVGNNVILTCNSSSTTLPRNDRLGLMYTWTVDGTVSPSESRYIYSNNNRTLTLEDVEKEDSRKEFTCTATEDVRQGYTSVKSEPLFLTILYGPDNLRFNPTASSYISEENTTLGSVTCDADCNPTCTFKWTKIGQVSDISSSAVLSLGKLASSEAGTYRCTATRGGTEELNIRMKNLTVSVIYGPRRMYFTPVDTSYRRDENFLLPAIACGSECWDCEYSWTGPNSYYHKGLILNLGRLTKAMAGSYTCSARNIRSSQQPQQSKDVNIEVRYGPDSVSLSPQTTSYTVDEGSTLNDIQCSADCYPACTYRWTKGHSTEVSQTDTLSLGIMEKLETGKYTCTATNGDTPSKLLQRNITVTVRYGPYTSSTELSPLTPKYTLNDGTFLSDITCSADCYPNCIYTWEKTRNGQTSVVKNDGILALGTLNSNDAGSYMCTARNPGKANSPTTSVEVKVNVRYGPDSLNISVQSPYTVTEGEAGRVITCSSDCYPGCNISWTNETDGSSSLGGDLTLGTMIRYMAGLYTCTGRNTAREYAKNKEKNVTVIVNYPPDVRAFTQNTTVSALSVSLTCNASGIPNSRYTYGKWIQKWPGTDVIVKEYTGSPSLVLDTLTYEHSGVYSCSASNGIKEIGTNREYMEGSVQLLVKSHPVILNVTEKVPGRLKENVTIQIDYYSNVKQSEMKLHKIINGSGQLKFGVANTYDDFKVNLPVFSGSILTDGTRAAMTVRMDSKEDFGFYLVFVTNKIGTVNQTFEIVPRGPPSEPYSITMDIVRYESARFSWIRGYHGGSAQTFVVDMSIDLQNWEEKKTVFGGSGESEVPITAEVTGLRESTLYFLRMYAFNEEGNSSYSAYVNFTTLTSRPVTSLSSALIGGVAGGVSGVVVIVTAVVAVVLLKRRNFFTKGKTSSSDDTSDRKPVYKEEDNDYGMQDNPMYVSAGPRNDKQATSASSAGDSSAEYSTVNKTKLVTSTTGVYAEVDRTKKNKTKQEKKHTHEKSKQGLFKDKKGKKLAQEGDIYENALTTKLNIKKAKPDVNNEPVYENPEPAKNKGKKNVNKDGLIYADLAFNDQPKGQRKLVIRGLDDMTEYVQVDFTKKADPLPDSDDEIGPPKN